MLVIVALLVPALPMAAMADVPSIGAIAEDAGFTTLLAAAEAAGLDEALYDCDADPITVFAPTNAAFAALADSLGVEVQDLLVLPNLLEILQYHILAGEVYSTDLPMGSSSATTLLGEDLDVVVSGEPPVAIRINDVADVNFELRDIQACNGVIHVIDAVLVPEADEEEPCKTIAEIAAEAGIFNTLLAAAGIAGLDEALADPDFGPVTVFAPTDTAFAALEAALGEEAWAALLADPDALRDVLLYHLLDGEVYAADVLALVADGPATVPTLLDGESIEIELTGDGVVINGVALVIETDIEACNGVIHVIDAVLVPPVDEEVPPVTAPEVEEAVEELVPGLPATGLGPDRAALPWQAVVLASLVLGLAYSTRRRNAVSPE